MHPIIVAAMKNITKWYLVEPNSVQSQKQPNKILLLSSLWCVLFSCFTRNIIKYPIAAFIWKFYNFHLFWIRNFAWLNQINLRISQLILYSWKLFHAEYQSVQSSCANRFKCIILNGFQKYYNWNRNKHFE